MMNVKLRKEGNRGLKKAYFRGNTFQHNTGNSIKLFPFRTKGAEKCYDEFRLFHGVVGEAFRICNKQRFDKAFASDKDATFNTKLKTHILDEVVDSVRTNIKDELRDTIINLFFGDDGELMKFNGKVLPYMNFKTEHPALNEMAFFITDVFLNKQEVIEIIESDNAKDNLFYQLIVDCLPEHHPHDYESKHTPYFNAIPEINELFEKDFSILKKDSKAFLSEIENLFKYYYFLYMTQLSKRLNHFGELQEVQPVFFSMDWESLSGSRLGYQFGWNVIASEMQSLFAHVNTVELLNYIQLDDQSIGDYSGLIRKVDEMEESEIDELKSKVIEVITFYESGNAAVFQDGGREVVDQRIDSATNSDDSDIILLVKKLFTTVSFVLEKTGRITAGNRYADWILSFCKVNFTKNRGRLGTTLSLTQEMLLFLVKLCVGEADKIRLNSLWTKLELRGLKFDEVSKTEIIRLFERINLLEKKSDSGDAQYVKSII